MKIPLHSHGDQEYVEIDDADADLVIKHRWYRLRVRGSHTTYARTTVGAQTVYLHRLLLAAGATDEIDHIDGNGLNNRRSNLRFVTHTENLRAAARLPGRYGNPTVEAMDRELAAFEMRLSNAPGTEGVKKL